MSEIDKDLEKEQLKKQIESMMAIFDENIGLCSHKLQPEDLTNIVASSFGPMAIGEDRSDGIMAINDHYMLDYVDDATDLSWRVSHAHMVHRERKSKLTQNLDVIFLQCTSMERVDANLASEHCLKYDQTRDAVTSVFCSAFIDHEIEDMRPTIEQLLQIVKILEVAVEKTETLRVAIGGKEK